MFGAHHLSILICFIFFLTGCLGDTNHTLDDIEKNTSRMAEQMKYVKEIEKIGQSISATQSEIAEMNQSFTGFWNFVQTELAKVSTSTEGTQKNQSTGTSGRTQCSNSCNPADYRVKIFGEDCIQAPAHRVAEVVTNYKAYPDNKRAAVLKMASFPMLKLTEVNPLHSLPESTIQPTDLKMTLIKVTLHATHSWLDDEKLFPRFVLQCITSASDEIDFIQVCSLAKNQSDLLPFVSATLPDSFVAQEDEIFERFGIDGFYAVIKVKEAQEECKESEHGPNLFSYDIHIQPNDEQIASIKKQSIADLKQKNPVLGYLASAVSELFGDKFFEVYYKNYYEVWIEDFRP